MSTHNSFYGEVRRSKKRYPRIITKSNNFSGHMEIFLLLLHCIIIIFFLKYIKAFCLGKIRKTKRQICCLLNMSREW